MVLITINSMVLNTTQKRSNKMQETIKVIEEAITENDKEIVKLEEGKKYHQSIVDDMDKRLKEKNERSTKLKAEKEGVEKLYPKEKTIEEEIEED